MNTKNNKRSQETQQKIEDAFVSLLQEKSFHEIEISGLCEMAQIDRSTFYTHYADLTMLASTFAEKTEEMVLAYPHVDGEYAWIFSCIKEHPEQFTAYFKLGIRDVQADYQTLFLRSAVHGVAKLWFENGCMEAIDQMGALIKREIHG